MSEDVGAEKMSLVSMWRVARGRHRAAQRLALTYIAFAVSGPITRAGADGLARSSFLGGLLDGIAGLLNSPVTMAIFAAVACVTTIFRLHPAVNAKYAAALAYTPWRPGRPLPMGDFSLRSSLVILPAIAIPLVAAVGLRAALPIAYGAVLGYAFFGMAAATAMRADAAALLIGVLLIMLIPATNERAWPYVAALGAMQVALASVALRGAATRVWRDGSLGLRRFTVQKRSTLGWFEQLPLRATPRPLATQFLGALAVGVAVASLCVINRAFDARGYSGAMTTALSALAIARFVASLNLAPLSYGIVARVFNGLWFVPRMDRLLIAPAAIFALIEAARWFPWLSFSIWNAIFGGAFVTAGLLIALWTAPTRLQWQITGTSRIPLVPNKTQKQAETKPEALDRRRLSFGYDAVMFVFFSNRMGCLGSIAVSVVASVVLILILRGCSR